MNIDGCIQVWPYGANAEVTIDIDRCHPDDLQDFIKLANLLKHTAKQFLIKQRKEVERRAKARN